MGRVREVTVLQVLLAQAEAGEGQVVGIIGEPGMGKTRLLDEFRRHVGTERVMHVEGYCQSYGRAVPFLPIRDLLRQTCGITELEAHRLSIARYVLPFSISAWIQRKECHISYNSWGYQRA